MNKELMALIQPELTEAEIRELCRAKKEDLGFDIEKALFPVNPLLSKRTINLNDAIKLVEEWSSVWDSARDSVWASVRDSVWASVRDSVWAYTSSIFYGIENWKGVQHESGVNPFSAAIELLENGYVASYDGELWRLHCGEDAAVVWSGSFDKLITE